MIFSGVVATSIPPLFFYSVYVLELEYDTVLASEPR